MKTPLISIIHASYGRPEKALRARRMWLERCVNPERVEYAFCLNEDDPERNRIIGNTETLHDEIILGPFIGSAHAWYAGAIHSKGALLIQASDDLEPPQDWDLDLCKRVEWEAGPDWFNLPIFVDTCDGYRKADGELCTAAIMTRAYAEQKGDFVAPCYRSVFSDDENHYRAKKDARDGKVKLIVARDLVFLHRHHYHEPKTVPFDATYARGNSAEAYAIGEKLFFERNPEARTDGLRTWK